MRLLALAPRCGANGESDDDPHRHPAGQHLLDGCAANAFAPTGRGTVAMIKYARRFIEPQDYYRRWIDRRVHRLTVADVIRYLQARGWTQVPTDRPGFLVFREPPGPDGQE